MEEVIESDYELRIRTVEWAVQLLTNTRKDLADGPQLLQVLKNLVVGLEDFLNESVSQLHKEGVPSA